MNKIIKVTGFGIHPDVKSAIKSMIDQLERYNFSYCNNSIAFRIFSRYTPECYKKNDTLVFSRVVSDKNTIKNIISLQPNYKIERYDDFSFRVKLK